MKQNTNVEISLDIATGWKDYCLLDSGNGKTLEQFGPYTLVRPEPQVIWKPSLLPEKWRAADAVMQETRTEYGGQWKLNGEIAKTWVMSYGKMKFQVQLASSRHIGLFPEQASQWDWIINQVSAAKRPLKVLNLFGYTGIATVAATMAGAEVTHVDSSKHSLTWANHNMSLSELGSRPMRWIAEDALKFIKREAKRGNRYDGLILDPPKFGRGTDGNVWEFFKNLPDLLKAAQEVLSTNAQFVVLTAYAIQASAIIAYQAMQAVIGNRPGEITCGELLTQEKSAGHLLSHALYSRWTSQPTRKSG